MADRKDKKFRPRSVPARKQMSERSPNPHGESKIIEMPIRTDQRRETRGQNIAQTPNTIGGRLHPSVAHDPQPKKAALINEPAPARTSRQPKASQPGSMPDASKEKKA